MIRQGITTTHCNLVDAVLLLSFDRGELLNLCSRHGVRLVGDEACPEDAAQAARCLHRAAHERPEVARSLERTLDFLHGETFAALEGFAPDALVRGLCELLESGRSLAGTLWALTTLDGPGFSCLRTLALGRLAAFGAEALAARTLGAEE